MSGRPAIPIIGPGLGQIKGAIDQSVALIGHVATPIWQLVILPADPVYWRVTPQEAALPFFKKPVSSITRTSSGSARVDDVVAHHIAQGVRVPLGPPEQGRLLDMQSYACILCLHTRETDGR